MGALTRIHGLYVVPVVAVDEHRVLEAATPIGAEQVAAAHVVRKVAVEVAAAKPPQRRFRLRAIYGIFVAGVMPPVGPSP